MSHSAHAQVATRLLQMRSLWEQAAKAYFDPLAFRLALQTCVTTSRTVTFILQSNKDAIQDFEPWYQRYQDNWRANPIMRWAVDARNTVEKQGDLEMYSQVRAKIIASYLGAISTDWMPQALFFSPHQILRSIPKRFHTQQIVEHGSLLIERRWVHAALPQEEVLSALTHVYGELAKLVNELAQKSGVGAPPIEQTPLSMKPLLMDRAIYLAIKDGSEIGMRLFPRSIAPDDYDRVARRYRKHTDWSKAPDVKTFRDLCYFMFANARGTMLRDHYHSSLALLFKGMTLQRVIRMDHPSRASRYIIVRELAELAKAIGADGAILIAEAWTATRENVPPSGYAAEAKKRGEALVLGGANAEGECYQFEASVERKRVKRDKVKRLGPTQIDEEFSFILAPFQEAWGCLDIEVVKRKENEFTALGIDPAYDEPAPE